MMLCVCVYVIYTCRELLAFVILGIGGGVLGMCVVRINLRINRYRKVSTGR